MTAHEIFFFNSENKCMKEFSNYLQLTVTLFEKISKLICIHYSVAEVLTFIAIYSAPLELFSNTCTALITN